MRISLYKFFRKTYSHCCIFLFGITLCSAHNAFGQCQQKNNVIISGEKLQYDVVYNWHMVLINAGSVTYEANNKLYKGQKVYECRVTGLTKKGYDWIYKVQDYFYSYIDSTTMRPLVFFQSTQEGDHRARNSYIYNYNKNKIYTTISTSVTPLRYDTIKIEGCLQDVVSAVYQLRNMDFYGA